jgi:cell shape-determining protein MreD
MPFYLLTIISFIVTLMLQIGIVSRAVLLAGSADVMLLFIAAWSLHQDRKNAWILVLAFGFIIASISAGPFFIPLITYMLVFFAAKLMHHQIWRTPLLSMFLLTFFGTLFQNGLHLLVLWVQGVGFSFTEAFTNILLPSVLLNMLLAIPVHALVQELFPSELPVGAPL